MRQLPARPTGHGAAFRSAGVSNLLLAALKNIIGMLELYISNYMQNFLTEKYHNAIKNIHYSYSESLNCECNCLFIVF